MPSAGAPVVTYGPSRRPWPLRPRHPSRPRRRPHPAPAVEAPKAAAPKAAAAGDVEGDAHDCAPMPGMIVKYVKDVGDKVKEGETIVVLEAMKMENALPAPTGGTVKTLNFSSGDSVKKGDVLAVVG